MIVSWPLVAGALLLNLVSTSSAATTVSTFAGTGEAGHSDGPRLAATFTSPHDITVDSEGNVYVAETLNGPIRKITPDGVSSTLNVNWRSNRNVMISGIAVNAQGDIFASCWKSDIVFKINPNGNVSVFTGGDEPGYADGPANVARFRQPTSITFDSDENMIVADKGNHCIRKITPDGLVSTLAGSPTRGFLDGVGAQAQFNHPYAVAVDPFDNVYVADKGNFCVRKIMPNGTVSTLAGNGTPGFRDGPSRHARFSTTIYIAVDANGNVFVTDWIDDRIRKITPGGFVSTIAGGGGAGFRDGSGSAANFNRPAGITIDFDGNLLVADIDNNRIRKITLPPGDNLDDMHEYYKSVQPRPIRYNKDECAICYEVKTEGDEYEYCSTSCGNTFHKRCIDRCMTRRSQRKCPMCRSRWIMNKPFVAIPSASPDDE